LHATSLFLTAPHYASQIVENRELNPEFYLDIINELTIEELLVAKKIYELKMTDKTKN